MENLADSFRANADRLGLGGALFSADTVAVGFSGGADSGALLYLLCECCPDADIRAVHVNHMIRGESADRDEEHCRRVCEKLGVGFTALRADVPAEAEKLRIGLEEAARQARYRLFDGYLGKLKAEGKRSVLATAHNADDNLETLIFNLIRGSGTRGLGGIAPRRGDFVRPMLCYTSAQIRDFCREKGIDFVTDETNSDTRYTRNLIRSEIVPRLRALSPSCASSALSASLLLRRDEEYLDSLAIAALGDSSATSADTALLRGLDDCVLSRAVLTMYTNARGGRKDFGSVHIDACIGLIRRADSGELCLPGRITMKIYNGRAVFLSSDKVNADAAPFSFTLPVSAGEICGGVRYFDFSEAGFCLALSDASLPEPENPRTTENIYKISIHTTISFDKIIGSITVRSRRPGDTVIAGKMTKKVKKLFCAAHTDDRDSVPIFCDDEGIFYIPGVAVADRARGCPGDIRISYWR